MSHLDTALTKLALAFKETLEPARKKIYLEVLLSVPLEDVLAACDVWLSSDQTYFPRPGQLRTLALNLPGDPRAPEALKDRAEQAWHHLRVTAGAEPYNRWALQDSLTRQTFAVMGGGYTTPAGFGRWDACLEERKHREFVQTYLDLAQGLLRHGQQLPGFPTKTDALRLQTADDERGMPHDDSEQSTEDYRQHVRRLVKDLQDKLAMPPDGVPKQYLRDTPAGQNPLDYTPSLSPDELRARKSLLLRQGQALMALELAQTQGGDDAHH